jgi:hypothetical protein
MGSSGSCRVAQHREPPVIFRRVGALASVRSWKNRRPSGRVCDCSKSWKAAGGGGLASVHERTGGFLSGYLASLSTPQGFWEPWLYVSRKNKSGFVTCLSL